MRIAIVGSRGYPDLERVRSYVRNLPAGTAIVSGGAQGVDKTAEQTAKECRLETRIYPADWSQGRGAGLKRNLDIIADAEMIVAFWDGQSRGTLHTITEGMKRGKKVIIYVLDEIPMYAGFMDEELRVLWLEEARQRAKQPPTWDEARQLATGRRRLAGKK